MLFRVTRALLFLLSFLALLAFTVVAVRVVLRHDVFDPVEVVVLEQARRFAQGEARYTPPSSADDPSLMPGFPLATAALVSAFESGLWEPRVLALLAALILAGLVVIIVRLETQSWTLAVVGMGLVFMGYGILAEPPGVGRPDTLMLVLAMLGFLALRLTNGIWGAILAALLCSAAFYTGAEAVWFLAAAIFALAFDDRKRLATFTLVLGVVVGGGYVALSQWLGPWFNFRVLDAPLRALEFRAFGPLHYIGDHLLGKLGVQTMAAVLSFALPIQPWRGKGGLWMCMAVAALAAGITSTQVSDFGRQSLIPSIVVLALVGPISMQRVIRHLSVFPGSTRLAGQGVVLAALALQFVVFLSCVSSSPWVTSIFGLRDAITPDSVVSTPPAPPNATGL